MSLIEINHATRNGRVLFDFVCYCIHHPEERFWQALRNWSGYSLILAQDGDDRQEDGDGNAENQYDTFDWEGRHDHK